ncbi:MAG: type II toxin-antitoxin system VapB family antitoxin [Polaromonas sp.]|uniref:type II toxin-antitoxin system VapB family antitoxin n=1 Tax=Polaromonas sp. TaxID=1869339 RepID=UPI0027361782|nr:type II toxin-antitoxin system VapB family antitoxin [Polaromonas sp.]MDP2817325.1 type II toxin-antitoxin system VapB family antitoxin [Polaromonas sp.]
MNTRTNIVLDDDLVAQAMILARVTTKKAAVEAALRAYVRKPDYSGILALSGKGLIDPDYDPKGFFGLTQEALARRGLHTFEDARIAHENQLDGFHKKTSRPAKSGVTRKRPALDAA